MRYSWFLYTFSCARWAKRIGWINYTRPWFKSTVGEHAGRSSRTGALLQPVSMSAGAPALELCCNLWACRQELVHWGFVATCEHAGRSSRTGTLLKPVSISAGALALGLCSNLWPCRQQTKWKHGNNCCSQLTNLEHRYNWLIGNIGVAVVPNWLIGNIGIAVIPNWLIGTSVSLLFLTD